MLTRPEMPRASQRKKKAPAAAPVPVSTPLDQALKAVSEDEILAALSRSEWVANGGEGECPDDWMGTPQAIAAWLYSGADADLLESAQRECSESLYALLQDDHNNGQEWSWAGVEVPGARSGREEPHALLVLVAWAHNGVSAVVENNGLVRSHGRWVKARQRLGDEAPLHPARALVRAWQGRRRVTTPESRRQGIMPVQFGKLGYSTAHRAVELSPPDLPGPVTLTTEEQACLPDLEPVDRDGRGGVPALILGLFDLDYPHSRASARPSRRPVAPVAVRVAVELMLATPFHARNGCRHELGPVVVREIAGDWLGWNPQHYRPSGTATGLALARGVAQVHNVVIPYGRSGGYFPARLDRFTGWELDGQLFFDVRLPQGSGVGPPVDRNVLRELGVRSARAYRAYLWLIFQWDRYGGHAGRLIKPMRRRVKRNEQGILLDARGRVITDRSGQPVTSANDRRAIPIGGREPNPAVERYPEYGPENLIEACYSPDAIAEMRTQPNAWRAALLRSRETFELVEKIEGCVIMRLGPRRVVRRKLPGFPWRILPPDAFANHHVPARASRTCKQPELDLHSIDEAEKT